MTTTDPRDLLHRAIAVFGDRLGADPFAAWRDAADSVLDTTTPAETLTADTPTKDEHR